MVVTHVIVVLQQCFEVTRMTIKYYSQRLPMYLVYHVVWCSEKEHSGKRAITKLRFHYRIKTNFFSQSFRSFESLENTPVFCEVFLHNFLMWLLQFSLLSLVTPSIFCSLLFFENKSFIYCILSETHEITFPGIKSHVIFLKPSCKLHQNQYARYF